MASAQAPGLSPFLSPLSRYSQHSLSGFHPQLMAGLTQAKRPVSAAAHSQTIIWPHPGEPDRLAHTLACLPVTPPPQPNLPREDILHPLLHLLRNPGHMQIFTWSSRSFKQELVAPLSGLMAGRAQDCVWVWTSGRWGQPRTLHTAVSFRGLTRLTGTNTTSPSVPGLVYPQEPMGRSTDVLNWLLQVHPLGSRC